MAVNYVSTDDFDAVAGGSGVRQKLYTPAGGSYSSTNFTRASQLASSRIQAAAQAAGYTLGATTTIDIVILATIGQQIKMAYGAKLEQIPQQFAEAVSLADDMISGRVPIPGLTPSTGGAVGGASFTGHTTESTTDHPQVFNRDFLDRY